MCKLAFTGQLSLDLIFGNVDKLPKIGEEVLSETFDLQLGGGTLVYPIILTRLGIDCSLLIKKGTTIQWQLAMNLLNDCGIQEVKVVDDRGEDPVMVTAVISMPKDRSFVSYNDRQALTFPDSVLREHYKDARVIFATDNNRALLPFFKERGSTVVFDVGWSEDLNIEDYVEILQYVDYFTPNEKEAKAMTGASTVEESLRILNTYVPHPIVSCGGNGCVTVIEGKIHWVPVPDNIQAVDMTGAGDNFMAGLIYGLVKEMPLEDAMCFANCTGALSTTGYGCYGADYSIEDVWQQYEILKKLKTPTSLKKM